jgi:hypothetical protein
MTVTLYLWWVSRLASVLLLVVSGKCSLVSEGLFASVAVKVLVVDGSGALCFLPEVGGRQRLLDRTTVLDGVDVGLGALVVVQAILRRKIEAANGAREPAGILGLLALSSSELVDPARVLG